MNYSEIFEFNCKKYEYMKIITFNCFLICIHIYLYCKFKNLQIFLKRLLYSILSNYFVLRERM